MITPVVVLNLFFVPAVALWTYGKRRRTELEPTIKLLLQYAILAVCNVPLTKVGIVFARALLKWEISIDSGYYTLLSIMAAAVLPSLLDWARAVYADRVALIQKGKVLLAKRTMNYGQKLLTSLLLVGLIVIAYVVRGPLEIYAGNTKEFLFTLGDFLPWILLIALLILAAASGLLSLLPDVLFHFTSALLLWFGVASWMQDLFLNKKLVEVNGAPMDCASLGSLPKKNLLVWLMLLAGIFIVYIIRKQGQIFLTRVIAGALCIVQLVAVISLFIAMPERELSEIVLSGEEQLNVASEENIIVFVLDTITPYVISDTLEQYPEAKEIIKDFVNYDNACCNYYSTFPSITHFLTGNEMDFTIYAEDWLWKSWMSERCKSFYQKMRESGFICRLYSFSSAMGYMFGGTENLFGKFDNVQSAPMRVDIKLLLKKLLTLSVYRDLPYVAKPSFEVLTSEFNDVVTPRDIQVPVCANAEYYQRLMEQRLSIDPKAKKLFIVDHLWGTHMPCQTGADGTFQEEATPVETMRGLFTIMEEYFDQLKALGLYDSATIIIMGDHGDMTPEGMTPGFYLKRAGETREHTEVNSAPVDYNDFQATILELIGENDGSFGTSFFDWKEGDTRRRVVYTRIVNGNAPEVKESYFNQYYGYIYYRNAEELRDHIVNDGPDIIETANEWRVGPW